MAALVHPSGSMQQMVHKELKEDPKSTPEKLSQLKEWMAMQPHLPPYEDDERLTNFLRGCKFSVEKAKQKIDMYFSMRAAVPEFFSNRDPTSEENSKVWDEVHMPPLYGLTKEGNRVILMCGAQPELNLSSSINAMKLALMIGDLRLKMESVGVAGDVYVMDASYATTSQFAKFTPAMIKKFLIAVQEAYPVRLRQVHIINVNPLVDIIWGLVKPLLKEKIRDRIHFHSKGYESLYKFIPAEILPQEYGGTAGPIADMSAAWRKWVEGERDWFVSQEGVKADETKRPGKQRNYDELFGADGSFRQLSID